jgi:hypothetical protein
LIATSLYLGNCSAFFSVNYAKIINYNQKGRGIKVRGIRYGAMILRCKPVISE